MNLINDRFTKLDILNLETTRLQETARLKDTERLIENAKPTPETARPIQEINNSTNPDININLLKIETDYERVVRKSSKNSLDHKDSNNSQTSLNSNEHATKDETNNNNNDNDLNKS